MPAYRKQVVTFLDIMGFRELVHSHDADAITEALDAIKATAAAPGDGEGEATSIISFSDSIIRARPCGKDAIAALLHEVSELASAQWSLMEDGVLVRGGITAGDVLMAPDRAFGPAFIRAYDLESKSAVSPRVIVDPDFIEELRETIKTPAYSKRRTPLYKARRMLRADVDGNWFVDYVSDAYHRLHNAEHLAALKRHRETIIETANEFEPGSKVFGKYAWLIGYFNSSVDRFHKGVNGLKILQSDVPNPDL